MTTCRCINSGQSNLKFEYLVEFETEFENILGHESGAQVGSIREKNQRSKISCYCPFKHFEGTQISREIHEMFKKSTVIFPHSALPIDTICCKINLVRQSLQCRALSIYHYFFFKSCLLFRFPSLRLTYIKFILRRWIRCFV
jgi:hypothetical protein